MTRRALRRGALPLLAATLLAGGCATVPRLPPVTTPIADPTAFLQSRERFQLAGRVAGAVGGEGFNAQLDLQQRGAQSQLVLRSPLGFGSATVRTDGEQLEFRSSRGESLAGEAGMAALSSRLGFEPPVRSLRYWLLGVPDPTAGTSTAGGGPAFEQLGWRVTVDESKPTSVAEGIVDLPRRVTLERAPVRLRVVVDRWQLGR